jgi:hypothetical protein
VAELMERAYEDAYRQFIEPVVGASGERLAIASGDAHDAPRHDNRSRGLSDAL